MKVETSSGEIKNIQLGINTRVCTLHIKPRVQKGCDFRQNTAFNPPRSPAASHSRGPSVTPGMGAKVADTKVAMLRSVSEFVSLSSTAGAGAGVREASGDGSSGRAVVTSG